MSVWVGLLRAGSELIEFKKVKSGKSSDASEVLDLGLPTSNLNSLAVGISKNGPVLPSFWPKKNVKTL